MKEIAIVGAGFVLMFALISMGVGYLQGKAYREGFQMGYRYGVHTLPGHIDADLYCPGK